VKPGTTHEKTSDPMFQQVYGCLLDMARMWFQGESTEHTLQPTALVHEAYVRLTESGTIPRNQTHFFALASRVMREILVDHARRKGALKRGGDRRRMPLREGDSATFSPQTVDILALEDALLRFTEHHARAARVVELRFFGGLSIDETADVIGVSPRTVDLDWRFARAWLLREVRGKQEE